MSLIEIYKNKSVLVTGHTGFKGSWLALWLESLGAHVTGVSLTVPTSPSHYEEAGIKNRLDDIDNIKNFAEAGYSFNPEFSDKKNFVFTRK